MFEHSVELLTGKLGAWQEALASNLSNAAVAILVIVVFVALGRLTSAAVHPRCLASRRPRRLTGSPPRWRATP
ncbi:MAG: hypothetical protein PVI30_08825 [Myxococcales bacterium]|jgi:hypothetical protein